MNNSSIILFSLVVSVDLPGEVINELIPHTFAHFPRNIADHIRTVWALSVFNVSRVISVVYPEKIADRNCASGGLRRYVKLCHVTTTPLRW